MVFLLFVLMMSQAIVSGSILIKHFNVYIDNPSLFAEFNPTH